MITFLKLLSKNISVTPTRNTVILVKFLRVYTKHITNRQALVGFFLTLIYYLTLKRIYNLQKYLLSNNTCFLHPLLAKITGSRSKAFSIYL